MDLNIWMKNKYFLKVIFFSEWRIWAHMIYYNTISGKQYLIHFLILFLCCWCVYVF